MANSYVEYTTALNSGTGTNGLGQKTFTVPTNFININDIVAKGYNGSAWTELTIASRGTTTVELSVVPTGYATVRFFRRSSTEPLVDFQTGATLSETDLDTAYRQGLFVAQEVAEDADPEGGSGIGNIVNSQLAGGITQDKLAGGITNAQLAGSIADDKLASGVGTSANNLVKLDGTAKLPAVDGSQLTNVSAGKVLQMPFTQYIGTTSVEVDATWTAIDVLSVTITPSSTSSIIKLDTHIFHEWSNVNAPHESAWFFYRDTTRLAHPTAGSRQCGITTSFTSYHQDTTSTPEATYYSYFDSPNTTNPITYKVGVINYYDNTVYINRTVNDTDSGQSERGISFISATEIGA